MIVYMGHQADAQASRSLTELLGTALCPCSCHRLVTQVLKGLYEASACKSNISVLQSSCRYMDYLLKASGSCSGCCDWSRRSGGI